MSNVFQTFHAMDRATERAARSLWINLPLLVLSIALATVLWAFVTNQENPPLHRDLPFQSSDLDAVNVPRSMIVTGTTPSVVTVTLSGPRDAVNSVRNGDVQLQEDLRGIDPGGSDAGGPSGQVGAEVPLRAVLHKRGVRAQVDPPTVHVRLEPEVHKLVPVKVNLVDTLPIGFELDGQPAADPTDATVSGLKQDVDAVDAVYADLKLTGLSVTTSLTLPLRARSSDGNSVGVQSVQPQNASVKVSIKHTVFPRDVFVTVQTHGKPAPGYEVLDMRSDPERVTVAGTLDALNNVTTIATEDVELEGATQDVKKIVALKPQGDVTLVNPKTVVVTVSVAPIRAPGSVLVAPHFVGPNGASVQASTTALQVSFSGPSALVNAVKQGDVTAIVDINGLGPGSYSKEPKITLPPGLDLDAVQPSKVDFSIPAPPPVATPTR